MLNTTLLPFIGSLNSGPYIFQQDNGPCHKSKITKDWLVSKGVRLIEWPSRSSDLNLVENLWSMLSRIVYANGRQFTKVSELKHAILLA
jgi:hypothetical protein